MDDEKTKEVGEARVRYTTRQETYTTQSAHPRDPRCHCRPQLGDTVLVLAPAAALAGANGAAKSQRRMLNTGTLL